MMRGYLDRMMRPRDLELRFHRATEPGAPSFLMTSEQVRPGDLERIRQIDIRELVDGQLVKIPR